MLVLAKSLSLFLRKKTNIGRGLLTRWNRNALVREGRGPLRQEDESIFGGWGWGGPSAFSPQAQRSQGEPGLNWNLELPRSHGVLAGRCVPSQASGGPGKPAESCPPVRAVGCRLVTQPFPRGCLPGSRELICYLLGRLPEPSSPACVCSGLGSSETETSKTPGRPGLLGSCLGLPSMGRIRELGGAESGAWAGPADVAGSPRPPPRELGPPPPPPPPPGTSSGPWGSTWPDKPGWPCPSPPLRH